MNAVIRDWTNKNSIDRKLLCSPKKIEDHLGQTWNKPLSLEGIKKEKSFKLSQRDFRPENDTVFFGYGKEVENWAGNCSYFHPPKWYEGKALAVKDQEGDLEKFKEWPPVKLHLRARYKELLFQQG